MGLVNKGVGNIVGKGVNAGCQHFCLFQQCFRMVFIHWLLKVVIVRKMVNMVKIMVVVCEKVENISGKGENVYRHGFYVSAVQVF